MPLCKKSEFMFFGFLSWMISQTLLKWLFSPMESGFREAQGCGGQHCGLTAGGPGVRRFAWFSILEGFKVQFYIFSDKQ